jgi:hypothetical protein
VNRIVVARAASIVGHPAVLVPAAGLIAASHGAASAKQLQFIGGALLVLIVAAAGFTWVQVRAGRWSHVDASVREERTSLNAFLAVLFLSSALLLWTRLPPMAFALALSAAISISALLLARWVKASLHTAFAVFATAIVWPITPAVLAGVLLGGIVVWSRLVLGRHVRADIVAGLLLGCAAGAGYQCWIAWAQESAAPLARRAGWEADLDRALTPGSAGGANSWCRKRAGRRRAASTVHRWSHECHTKLPGLCALPTSCACSASSLPSGFRPPAGSASRWVALCTWATFRR